MEYTDHGVRNPIRCTPIVALTIQPEANPGLGHSGVKAPPRQDLNFRDDWSRHYVTASFNCGLMIRSSEAPQVEATLPAIEQ